MSFFLLSIHISAAIIWIGCILSTSILNILVIRKKDAAGIILLLEQEKFLGQYIIGPSAIITLLAGIAMSVFLKFGWPFWVIWGLIALVLTSVSGGIIVRKISNKITDVVKTDNVDSQQLRSLQKQLILWSSIIIVLLFSAVWIMVFKPTF
jgi:hypothetical protein